VKEDLEKFRVKEIDENFGATVVNKDQLSELLQQFDHVIFM
jgi:tRNA 2-thiouridine synthesizing protein C